MTRKKVIVFHPAIAPYRVDFFNSLDKAFDTTFYFNHFNVLDQEFDQNLLVERLSFAPKYLSSGFTILGRTIRFGAIGSIRKKQPEIVICSEYGQVTIFVFLYRILLRRKFKLYTISDDSIDNSKSRTGIRARLRNFISRRVDGVIFTSSAVCEWFENNISAKTKTLELPIIHDEQVFRADLQSSLSIVRENIIKQELLNERIVLFVGRLVDVKNIPVLITALGMLKTPNWKLVIVGSGNQEELLRAKVKNANLEKNIVFVGRKEGVELCAWYNIAEIFVLPSKYEPYGAVVNEALLAGCQVICSKLAGASALINDKNGLLFDPYDPSELAIKLQLLLNTSNPINPDSGNLLRENRMPFLFKDKIEKLISEL